MRLAEPPTAHWTWNAAAHWTWNALGPGPLQQTNAADHHLGSLSLHVHTETRRPHDKASPECLPLPETKRNDFSNCEYLVALSHSSEPLQTTSFASLIFACRAMSLGC